MRRALAICSVIAIALASAGTASAQSIEAQQTHLRSYVCQRALDPAERAISITAVMRPILSTAKMQMRFELMRRTAPTTKATSIIAHGLRTWITPSDPTIGQNPGDRWVVHHPVVDLAGPDLYRFKVSFRWLDGQGNLLGSIVRRSRTCFQPELRPDLAVSKIVPVVGSPNTYAAVIVNRGKTDSGAFQVGLTLGGVSSTQPESSLAPHQWVKVPFSCTAAEPITVTADVTGQVDDFDRSNNVLSETCPGTATTKTVHRRR